MIEMKFLFTLVVLLAISVQAINPFTGSVQTLNQHVVGGKDAKSRKYRWMSAIFYENKFHCTGVLVDYTKVLTTSYCAKAIDGDEKSFSVNIKGKGKEFAVYGKGGNQKHEIQQVITEEGHKFAIIVLTTKAKTKPIRLYTRHHVPKRGNVLGWGVNKGAYADSFDYSYNLKILKVFIRSRNTCLAEFPHKDLTHKFCAGSHPRAGCNDDDGAPLIVGKRKLYGLVSHEGCGSENDLYLSVSADLDWLMHHISYGQNPSPEDAEKVGDGYCRTEDGSKGVFIVACNPLKWGGCTFEECSKHCLENEACKAFEFKHDGKYKWDVFTPGRCELHYNEATQVEANEIATCYTLPDREEECKFEALTDGLCRGDNGSPGDFEVVCGGDDLCSLEICKAKCADAGDKCVAIEYWVQNDLHQKGYCEIHHTKPTEGKHDHSAVCMLNPGCYDY